MYLTERPSREVSLYRERRDDPEVEIEITPAMIEAGELAVMRFNLDYESPRDAAARIYREMVSSRSSR